MTAADDPPERRREARARLDVLMRGRLSLACAPTELHRTPRLSRALGRDLWVKRDDLTGFALGGNKVRKLELIVADASAMRADHLVTVGAAQSNHVRTVAAAAAAMGLRCSAVVGGRRPDHPSGNLVLDELFGATLYFVETADWADLQRSAEALAARLSARGERTYFIPVGGATPLGTLAFAAAYVELRAQCDRAGVLPAAIVHASSSGGTQAGLELGRWLCGDATRIVGVDVAAIDTSLRTRVFDLAAGAARLLGVDDLAVDPFVCSGYLGDGYGVRTPGGDAAQQLAARTEGIVLDHVYSAKAMHALIEEPFDGPLVFWHTGGSPAVFADAHGPQ